jgi:hypothetical protein
VVASGPPAEITRSTESRCGAIGRVPWDEDGATLAARSFCNAFFSSLDRMHVRTRPPTTAPAAHPRYLALMNNPETGTSSEAGEAIRAARAGTLPLEHMLSALLAAKVSVPLAEPPVMEGARMLSWKPATVTRDTDGQQFVVVFTDHKLDGQYAKWRPEYPIRLRVDGDWLMPVLPAGHGIIFNLGGGEILFEWSARDILAYQAGRQT